MAGTATFDFETMRHAMVASQLRTSGVSDVRVVAAMAAVARERFVGDANRAVAYADVPLPLAGGRHQNTPLATGRLLNAAQISPDARVLLIGAAGGYTASVLAKLARAVVAVEEDAVLVEHARTALADEAGVQVVEGRLAAGAPDGAPYDILVVDGAVDALPSALVEQVRPLGRVVAGLVDSGVARLAAGVRTPGGFTLEPFADIDCVILPGFARPRAFHFPG